MGTKEFFEQANKWVAELKPIYEPLDAKADEMMREMSFNEYVHMTSERAKKQSEISLRAAQIFKAIRALEKLDEIRSTIETECE